MSLTLYEIDSSDVTHLDSNVKDKPQPSILVIVLLGDTVIWNFLGDTATINMQGIFSHVVKWAYPS